MQRANRVAKKQTAKDKVKDGGKLNKNAEVGGVFDFESLVVRNAGESVQNSRKKKADDDSPRDGGKIKPKTSGEN